MGIPRRAFYASAQEKSPGSAFTKLVVLRGKIVKNDDTVFFMLETPTIHFMDPYWIKAFLLNFLD
jgi:hypothetical protein